MIDAILDYISDHAGVIGLIFFLSFFFLVLAHLFRPGAGPRYQSYGEIPLGETDGEEAIRHD